MNAQELKDFWRKSFTLSGRIFYPNLLKPTANKNGRLTYNTMFAWKIGSAENEKAMHDLNNFLMAAKTTFHPSVPMQFFVNPLKKWDTYVRQDGKPNPKFLDNHYWVNAQSGADIPPPVVDSMRQPIMNESEVYSGRNAVVNISFYNIDKEKKGIGCNINAVMLMAGGDKEGGSASVDINKIFGSFTQDMTPAGGNNNTNGNGNGFV